MMKFAGHIDVTSNKDEELRDRKSVKTVNSAFIYTRKQNLSLWAILITSV